MSTEFKREERYIVFKLSDLGNSRKGDEIRKLAREYAEHRKQLGKKPLVCVVVESDWPEYEPTWKAIEARVMGAQPAPGAPWVNLAERMPNPDKHDRVLIYTEGYDFGGEQVFDVKAEALNECRYIDPDEQPDTCKAASHWMPHPRNAMFDYAAHYAQPVPSAPECPYPCGWRNLLKHAIEDGAYLARSINEDEPVTENARAVTMRMVMRLRDVLMTINKAALAAAPEAKP